MDVVCRNPGGVAQAVGIVRHILRRRPYVEFALLDLYHLPVRFEAAVRHHRQTVIAGMDHVGLLKGFLHVALVALGWFVLGQGGIHVAHLMFARLVFHLDQLGRFGGDFLGLGGNGGDDLANVLHLLQVVLPCSLDTRQRGGGTEVEVRDLRLGMRRGD